MKKKQPTGIVVKKLGVSFTDTRGSITDILEEITTNHVGLITFNKGAVRGDHYHKKTTQYDYILEGKIKVQIRKLKKSAPITSHIIAQGDLIIIPPGYVHTFTALTESVMIDCANFPLKQDKDTYRVKSIEEFWVPRSL